MYELDSELINSIQQVINDYGDLKLSHLLILALFKNTKLKSTEIEKITGIDSAVCRTIKMRKSKIDVTWIEIEKILDLFKRLMSIKIETKQGLKPSVITKERITREKVIKLKTDTELQKKLLNDMSIAELTEKCRQLGISPYPINGKENIIKRIITKIEG